MFHPEGTFQSISATKKNLNRNVLLHTTQSSSFFSFQFNIIFGFDVLFQDLVKTMHLFVLVLQFA